MISRKITGILVDDSVFDHPYSRYVCSQFPDAELRSLNTPSIEPLNISWRRNKCTLHLTTFPGSFLKDCPATSPSYLCCQYRILSPVVGCPLDCSYCILQHYIGSQPIRVYVNWAEMLDQIRYYAREYPNRLIRFGSGELADSLALEPELGMVPRWISAFADIPNAILELKTKTADVDWLAIIPHRGRTVIGWSVNPARIVEREERGAAPVEARIQAAARVAGWGYKVAFHFDPILRVEGWESQYRELIGLICGAVSARSVAWVSLGSLRFPPQLREIIRRRFPKSRILDGEWVIGMDGKHRLIKPLRIELFRKVHQWLREGWGDDICIYLCMEGAEVWRKSMGWEPMSRDEVERGFEESWSGN